jgi:hypothetical protein
MGHLAHFKKIAAGIGIVGALTAVTVMPALADSAGVAQEITPGTLDVTIPADVSFASDGASTAYSHTGHTVTSDMFQIAIDDSTGSKDGWNVTMAASALTAGTETIAATNIALASIGDTTLVAGQDATNITEPTVANTALDSAKIVANAPVNEGQGSYTLDTTIEINIPAYQPAGAYSGTITVDVTTGPSGV